MPRKNCFKTIDLGTKFGKLTVIGQAAPIQEGRNRTAASICLCDCGNEIVIRNYVLRRGNKPASSCGCTRRHGQAVRSAKSREYRAWNDMKTRCRRDPRYQNISVCQKWLKDFPCFFHDMGPCPLGATLDRIDNNRGYEPGNCRWASIKAQNNNRRSNRVIVVNGVSQTVSQWMEAHGLHYTTFYRRLQRGWSEEDAASRPRAGAAHRLGVPLNGIATVRISY